MKTSYKPYSKVMLAPLIGTLLLAGCGSDGKEKHALESYNGVWIELGTPNIWQFSNQQLTRFQTNDAGCVLLDKHAFSELDVLKDNLKLTDNKLTLVTHATSDWQFARRNALPEQCVGENLLSGNNPIENFEFLWHLFNESYAFFHQREIDWQAYYQHFRPMVTEQTTEQELAVIFEQMLSAFNDSHVNLSDGGNVDIDGGAPKGLSLEVVRYIDEYGDGDDWSQAEDLYYQQVERFQSLILSYSDSEPAQLKQLDEGTAIRWTTLTDNVGYIQIIRESSILLANENENLSLFEHIAAAKQDIADTEKVMRAVMTDLANTSGIIIDLRLNDGGYDKVSEKIASFFTSQPRDYAKKQIHNASYQQPQQTLTLEPSPITAFEKPVYVLTGQSSVSAGEVLTQALSVLPNVKLVGQPTNGAVSDMMLFTLPNGWQGSLSHQVYYNDQGNELEVAGVEPDIEVPTYSVFDTTHNSDTPLSYAIQALGKKPKSRYSLEEMDKILDENFDDLGVPGVALAMIHDGKIIFEKGYGSANVETNRPMTANTPVNIGSVSKAVMAVSIMQKVENGDIDLDAKLNDFNLPFTVQSPYTTTPITLKHLVTHTSGIRDTLSYICSYYKHDDLRSLHYSFNTADCSEFPITDPTDFYRQYLLTGGKYFSDAVYAQGEEAEPGSVYEYSNVASGLAGYAVEQMLNINLAEDMKLNLFDPLGMNDTNWNYQALSPLNPKAQQYTADEEGNLIAIPEFSYPTFYDGDLNSSAHDLAVLLLALANGGELNDAHILKPSSIADMLSEQTDEQVDMFQTQGVFWIWQGPFVGHDGGDPGSSALISYNPYTKTGFAMVASGNDDTVGKGQFFSEMKKFTNAFSRAAMSQ
ncbi:serine hydrolase [Pseudoalteromonas sp. T1lg65]|uniref:serine hydrolase n=1 Tax=Pseudoalteromonas sp. T1lg65 TaxID=2077101 RepID=UPI003F7918F2